MMRSVVAKKSTGHALTSKPPSFFSLVYWELLGMAYQRVHECKLDIDGKILYYEGQLLTITV